MLANPVIRRMILASTVGFTGAGMIDVAMFSLVDQGLHRPTALIGVLTSIEGAGSVLAGLAVGPMMRRMGEYSVACIGFLLNGAGLAAASTATLAGATGGAVLIGIGLPMVLVAELTVVQRRTPADASGPGHLGIRGDHQHPVRDRDRGRCRADRGRRIPAHLHRSGGRFYRGRARAAALSRGHQAGPGSRRAASGPGRGGLTSSAVGMSAADLLRQAQSPMTGLYRRHPERNLGTVAAAIVSAYRETGPVSLGPSRSLVVIAVDGLGYTHAATALEPDVMLPLTSEFPTTTIACLLTSVTGRAARNAWLHRRAVPARRRTADRQLPRRADRRPERPRAIPSDAYADAAHRFRRAGRGRGRDGDAAQRTGRPARRCPRPARARRPAAGHGAAAATRGGPAEPGGGVRRSRSPRTSRETL